MNRDAADQSVRFDDENAGDGAGRQHVDLSLTKTALRCLAEEAHRQKISVSDVVEQLAHGLQSSNGATDSAQPNPALLHLQQRFEEFQTLFEGLPICVGIAQDAECQQIRINPAFSKLLGVALDPSHLLDSPKPPFRIFRHGQELPSHELPLQHAAQQQTEVRDAEIDILRDDGTVSNLYGYATPLLNEQGIVRGAVSAFLDVTILRQIEAELRRSETRFRRLVETSVFGVAIGDFSGKISYANNAFLSIIGYTQDELDQLNWIELTPPEQRASKRKFVETVAQHGIVPPFEQEYLHKQGHRVPILIGGAVLGESGDTASNHSLNATLNDANTHSSRPAHLQEMVAFCIDLTRLKQTEATLRAQEEQYRFLAESIPHFVWTARSDGSGEYYNRRCLDYLGTTAEQMQMAIWTQFVHPDDVAQAITVWTDALTQKRESQVEVRICRVDHVYRWFECRMVPFRDSRNRMVRWFATCTDIDDRKRAEQELRRSEEQFRLLVEHAPDAILISNQEGVYLDVNASACRLLGYAREELVGKRTIDLIPPEDLPRLIATQELLLSGEAHVEEWTLIHKNGMRIPVEVSTKILSDNRWQAFVRNITDRKHAEAALRQSELNFRILADTMPQLFWTTRPDGYHDYFNKRWYEYTGMTLEQTQGWGWSHLLHPDDRPRCFEVWNESLRTGKDYNIEYRFRRASDRTYRWFLGRAFPLRATNGQILRWFGSCTDIQDQKCAIEERNQALEQEQIAREQAENANRIKDEFLAILSHELRSPLNPILGWTKLLRSRKFDQATTQRALETIERNAKLQTQLIEDLLDISRILCGKMLLDAVPINLVTMLDAALETVSLAAEAKGIQIETQFSPLAGQVSGDPNRLQQVVWNLLSNAVKFTPEGGKITIELSSVTVSATDLITRNLISETSTLDQTSERSIKRQVKPTVQRAAYAQLRIKDTGKGINPDFLPYVFESFRQEDGKTTRKFGGLGLGLAIVRHLVELHGGSVRAESAGEDLGATFTVTLPLLKSEPQSPSTSQPPTFSPQSTSLTGRRVLVVDDEADMQELVLVILQEAGATVQVATSAAEAIKLLKTFQPHLLISDIGMPEIDGYMLLHQIRQQHADRKLQIPAIAVTAYATEFDQRRALEAGFQRHLAKPIEPQELIKIVQEILALEENSQ